MTTYQIRPRNGLYGVDEFRDGKMVRNVLLLKSQSMADDVLAAIQNAADHASGLAEMSLNMAAARLGGTVEGLPTHRLNFLQRVDELRRIEASHARLLECCRVALEARDACYAADYDPAKPPRWFGKDVDEMRAAVADSPK